MPFRRFARALILVLAATPAHAADPADGAGVFRTQCGSCHSTQPAHRGVGPSLFGVIGRAAGQAPGFHYSPAMRAARFTWDTAALDRYLADPRGVVSGTIMPFAGLRNDAQRADLIAYLATLK